MIGREQLVLVEKFNPKTRLAKGYGQHYIPVEFKSETDLHNQFVRVKIDALKPGPDPILQGILIQTEQG